jgi:hypothetical protein
MKFTEILTEKVATRPNAISSMANQLTQKKPAAADTDDKDEPSTAGPGAGAFGQMANQLSGNKPNTMANAPVSASNKAKSDNPNLAASPTATDASATKTPSFAGPKSYGNTTMGFKAPAEKPTGTPTTQTPTSTPTAAQDTPAATDTKTPAATDTKTPAATEPEDKKPGLLQKIGKGFGDLVTGFKQGYSGNYNLDDEDDAPASTSAKDGTTSTAGDQTANAADAKPVTFASIKANVDKLDKKGKQRILSVLKKELGVASPVATKPASEPAAGQALDLDQLKQQTDKERAAGQNDQQQAIQQMKSTADANAAAAANRSSIEKAGKEAAAIPKFRRTASDNLAIKAAKDAGITIESKKSVKKKTNLKESKGFQLPFSLFKK